MLFQPAVNPISLYGPAMIGPVAIDVVDSQEGGDRFATAGALAAVMCHDLCFEFAQMLPGHFTARVALAKLPGPWLSTLKASVSCLSSRGVPLFSSSTPRLNARLASGKTFGEGATTPTEPSRDHSGGSGFDILASLAWVFVGHDAVPFAVSRLSRHLCVPLPQNYTRNHTIKSSPIRQWVLFPIGCWFLTVNGQQPRRIGPFSRALREADER